MNIPVHKIPYYLRFGFFPECFEDDNSVCCNKFIFDGVEYTKNEVVENGFIFNKAVSMKRKYNFEDFDNFFLGAIRKSLKGSENCKIGLMLSGGKDSTAIAYGLYRLGYRDVTCFTYVPDTGEDESHDATILCKALNFKSVVIKSNDEQDFEAWTYALKNSPRVCVDFAYPATCRIAMEMEKRGIEVLIDGMGNDIYMGHVPPKIETRLQALSLVPILGDKVWGKENNLISKKYNWKFKYFLSSVFMHPIERMFAGSHLSLTDIERLGLSTNKIKSFILNLQKDSKGLSLFDKRSYVRGFLFDYSSAMEKSYQAGLAYNIKVIYPFEDKVFADYYNSLVDEHKYDAKNRINKVALRFYLHEMRVKYEVNYSKYNSEKGSYRFDFVSFLKKNKAIKGHLLEIGINYPALKKYCDFYFSQNIDCKYEASKAFLVLSLIYRSVYINHEAQ